MDSILYAIYVPSPVIGCHNCPHRHNHVGHKHYNDLGQLGRQRDKRWRGVGDGAGCVLRSHGESDDAMYERWDWYRSIYKFPYGFDPWNTIPLSGVCDEFGGDSLRFRLDVHNRQCRGRFSDLRGGELFGSEAVRLAVSLRGGIEP